ncbi:MAG: hypothetical protein ACLTEE_07255 [Anaerobutyricum hallii]
MKPEDIRTGDDLSKLPLLTKDELRAWMNEEAKNWKYDCWFHDTTSGSSRNSADAARFSKGKGLQHGELVPCYDVVPGYNPFTGKTMSRKSAHSICWWQRYILTAFRDFAPVVL